MYVRTLLALGAVLLGMACEIPVDTNSSNPDFGVTSVAIQPKTAAVLVGDSLQLSASVVMSNNRPPNSVTWASANPSLATVSSAGVVRGRAAGGLYIRATSGSKRDSSAVTVMAASPLPVASVTLAPSSVTVTVGGTASLLATPKDASGNTLTGRSITWASSNSGVATVNGSGVVTAAAVGSATVTATSEGQSGSATVSVTTVPVASVSVSPATVSVQAGQTVQLTATPNDAGGNALSGRTVTWASSNVGVATVSGGVVTGVAAGSVTITATSEGQRGSAAVSVTAVPVASVSVSPATASVAAGQTVQLSATPKDANGNALSGRTVTWASSNGAVATVSGTGLVSGTAAGSATITATSEGHSGSAPVTVTVVPVASVTLSPSPASLPVAGTLLLTATLKDANGNVLSGRTIAWASAATGVATVNSTGLVTGVGAGSATITATSEGQSGTAPVSVTTSQPGQVTYYRTNFSDGTLGPLGFYSYNGSGTWAASTDYLDPGSAHSIKFTVPGSNSDDAAALQAWFGHGGLAGLPLDPTLDQDLFQEVRFVIAPGAATAIGGKTCVGNPTSQIKVHKSVYGQVGGNVNGWVMTDFAPCGGVGAMATEPELYGQPTAYSDMRPWPAPLPFAEGQVYDVVYRYHRYSASGAGTVAVWVNGVKVMDSVQRSYLGTTGGSGAGLVLWDGATYLQSPFGAYSVYVLFTQATNYPIGPATASP